MGKSSKDKRDAYYRLAKEQGYRARSAYKLLQLARTFDLFNSVRTVVDLCAAPGSWSQVLSRTLIKDDDPNEEEAEEKEQAVKIVSVDLQPIAPFKGVKSLCADITHPATVGQIMALLDLAPPPTSRKPGAKEQPLNTNVVDLLLCDGAPDVTGLHTLDTFLQSSLLLSALSLALKMLRPGGTFVAKIFRAKDVDYIYARLKCLFESVVVAKPRSSRASSVEAFVVCRGFFGKDVITEGIEIRDVYREVMAGDSTSVSEQVVGEKKRVTRQDGIIELELEAEEDERAERWIAPFVACGDLSEYDSDATYKLPKDRVTLDPVQPPIMPPYKRALELRRKESGYQA